MVMKKNGVEKDEVKNILKNLPRVDFLIEQCMAAEGDLGVFAAKLERRYLRKIINDSLDEVRQEVLTGSILSSGRADAMLNRRIEQRILEVGSGTIRRVVNGTGVLLHTNLGRAVVQSKGLDDFIGHYSNLEFDVETGERGSRNDHLSSLLELMTGCEAAIAVNNNAAAVMLVLAAIAKDKEVVISRGEQVEIGGSFRIPEVAELSGARLKEVGTTNRTRMSDYQQAMADDTAMIFRVEPSNFSVVGQGGRPTNAELYEYSKQCGVPYYVDLGSGLLDIDHLCGAVSREVAEKKLVPNALANADIVSFSGDKLLGSSQAGIIAGKKEYIDRLTRHPLYRAMRLDKATIYTLTRTISAFLMGEKPLLLNLIAMDADEVKERAERFLKRLEESAFQGLEYQLTEQTSSIGGGTFAHSAIPSYGVLMKCDKWTTDAFARKLRLSIYPVVTMVGEEWLALDFRTILEGDEDLIIESLSHILLKI